MNSVKLPNLIRRDLGLQLLAIYLLFVGPVVFASLIFDWTTSKRIESDVKTADLALARAIAQETNTTLNYAQQAVEQLARSPAVIAGDRQQMEPIFANFMDARQDVNLVYRLDADGIMTFHYPIGPGSTVGTDFSFRDYFRAAINSPKPVVSLGRISPTTQQPVTTVALSLHDEAGTFLGLVATNIKLESLSKVLSSITASPESSSRFSVTIIDSSGRVIAHPDPNFALAITAFQPLQVSRVVLDGANGNLILPSPAGEETLYSYVSIPSAGWGVIVSRPAAAAFATSRTTHQLILFAMGVFVVFGLIFWLVLSSQVLRPLERLAAFSQTIGLENPSQSTQHQAISILSNRPDQIGHLIRSLTRMEEAIEARLRELSTLLETSAAVVSSLDRNTVLNRILEQVERLMDSQTCAILALDEKRGVFRIQASRGLSRRYTEQLTIQPSEPQSVTLRAIRTGEPIQISDIETDTTYTAMRPRARAEGYRSLIAVPLNTKRTPPSALLVYRPEAHVFSPQEISLLTSFANHAAMAIENAALYSRSDMALREQTRRLEALIQSLHDGLILEDLQGNVLYANRRMIEMLRLSPQDVLGAPVQRMIERLLAHIANPDVNDKNKTRAAIRAALDGSGSNQIELTVGEKGQLIYYVMQIFNVSTQDAQPIGRGIILSDITRNRELDRMKSSLISTVSHELRTPLAAIKGYATTLLAEDVQWEPAAQREFLQIISDETDRLSELVNDLLDMSRIESGSLTVVRVQSHLPELVEIAAERAYPKPGNRLKVDFPEDLPPIYCDQQRIGAVLRNLIENATKYSGDDTLIQISARRQDDQIIVRVNDDGPGIPAEHSERIFESFYQLEDGLSRGASGAGLGLAICRGFVRAHGGEIWLEPKAKGTCIAFSLPMETSTPPAHNGMNSGEVQITL